MPSARAGDHRTGRRRRPRFVRGGGWIAAAALAIARYACACGCDVTHGLTTAVMHGGDSDPTRVIAGTMPGLHFPEDTLAHPRSTEVECADLIGALSGRGAAPGGLWMGLRSACGAIHRPAADPAAAPRARSTEAAAPLGIAEVLPEVVNGEDRPGSGCARVGAFRASWRCGRWRSLRGRMPPGREGGRTRTAVSEGTHVHRVPAIPTQPEHGFQQPSGMSGIGGSRVSRLCNNAGGRVKALLKQRIGQSIPMKSVRRIGFPTVRRTVGTVDGPFSGSTPPIPASGAAGASGRSPRSSPSSA
jgi:hypothetical protein